MYLVLCLIVYLLITNIILQCIDRYCFGKYNNVLTHVAKENIFQFADLTTTTGDYISSDVYLS